jgi:hypothetical protein
LNLGAFSGSVFDLEFDDQCNAWGVTTMDGADRLRRMTPEAAITTWTGVSNLNMSETAILRIVDPEFGEDRGTVALTYTCCVTCGCASDPPQGVALLDGDSLPMVISATPTSGSGPFGNVAFDTGPQGLVWGKNLNLYVGNVHANGEWARADLAAGTVDTVATLPGRVFAAYNFDEESLLVAISGGAVYLVGTEGGTPVLWSTFPSAITSLARDFFTGRVYVATSDRVIWEVDADGTVRGQFAAATAKGRLAISPDGWLYHLGFGATPRVSRWELPTRR